VFTAATGTNTYLVGRHNPYILVDTGEGRDHYITVLESALRDVAVIANPDLPRYLRNHRYSQTS
jgi:ribonuclease/clavin/mitogillin